jgi:hypothetical protein
MAIFMVSSSLDAARAGDDDECLSILRPPTSITKIFPVFSGC